MFVVCFFWFVVVGFRPREVAHLFSREISRRMPSESCLGTPWGSSYEHICKNIYFWKGGIGWDPWFKRVLKTISSGVFKVNNAWFLVSVMRILLWYHIMTIWCFDHMCNILYYTVLYGMVLYYTLLYYTIHLFTVLYCIILYYIILYCYTPYSTVLYGVTRYYTYYIILYYITLYCSIPYHAILYFNILSYTVLYDTILYYSVLYCTVQSYNILYCIIL